MSSEYPGELEQIVLLAVLRLGNQAFALAVVRELERRANRRVSRGALYKTLERLEQKGLVAWKVEGATPDRGGHPRRRFRVTPAGVAALRSSREALFSLWHGLDEVLGKPRP